MKYAWIDAQRRDYPLPDMCNVLSVSISGYRAWRNGETSDSTGLNDAQAGTLIKAIRAKVKGRGHRISIDRAEHVMREAGIRLQYRAIDVPRRHDAEKIHKERT